MYTWNKSTAAAASAAAKWLQSCPTLCDPIDGSPLGFPIPGILQARTLEWVAISFSSLLLLPGQWIPSSLHLHSCHAHHLCLLFFLSLFNIPFKYSVLKYHSIVQKKGILLKEFVLYLCNWGLLCEHYNYSRKDIWVLHWLYLLGNLWHTDDLVISELRDTLLGSLSM